MFEHIVVVVALLLLLLLDTDAREHRRHKDSTLRRHHHPTRRKRRRLRLSVVVVVCIETPIVSQSFLLLVVVYLSLLLLLFLFLRALLLLVLLLRLEREREREDVLGKRDGLRSRLRQKAQKFEAHDEIGERERDREERLLCSKMQCLGYYINPKYFFFCERATLGEFFCEEGRGIFSTKKERTTHPTTKKSF